MIEGIWTWDLMILSFLTDPLSHSDVICRGLGEAFVDKVKDQEFNFVIQATVLKLSWSMEQMTPQVPNKK